MLYEPNPGGHQILIGTNAQGPQIELRKEGLIRTRTNSVQAAGFDLSHHQSSPIRVPFPTSISTTRELSSTLLPP
jgi:hypothetical protein